MAIMIPKAKATNQPARPRTKTAENRPANPALTELLDHLAEELAREYVRLMEKAEDEQAENRGRRSEREEGSP